MRTALIRVTLAASLASFASLALGAACTKATPVGPSAPPSAAPERPPGTSGFPGLDWGANADDVTGVYPGAQPGAPGLTWAGPVLGEPAHVAFTMAGDGLQQVTIAFDAGYASMETCGETLHRLRPQLDARLGAGSEDNLGVFWDTPTASVVLACNPTDDDSGRAELTSTFQRRAAE